MRRVRPREHHDADLARAALCVAIAVRGGSVAGVVFHTDQGGEHTGELFAHACRHAGVTRSMGRTGSALDNAAAESFNSTVEFELLRSNHFATREQARRAVAGWIDEYNTVCRHSTDQMLSPVDYEHRQAQIGRVAAWPGRRVTRRAGYGSAPPASRVAARSLRDGLRPPLTPEPLRPPDRPTPRAGHRPAPGARGAPFHIT